jgi:hypothetical protein
MKPGRKIEVSFNARPHPGPLPRGEGEATHVSSGFASHLHRCCVFPVRIRTHGKPSTLEIISDGQTILPLPGERAGVRAVKLTIFS